MTIGERIKRAREKKALTRKALAELLKIDQSQYGKIENNKLNPTVLQIIDICSILDQSIDYILTGKKVILDNISKQETAEPNYKESYEMALKNMELQNEIIKLKEQIFQLEKSQIKSGYDIGRKDEPYINVAEPKPELEK